MRKKALNKIDVKLYNYLMMEIKNEDPDKIASKVNVTMKTHKEKGKVYVRLIHTSVGSPFTAFCSFVGAMIRKRLEACSDFL